MTDVNGNIIVSWKSGTESTLEFGPLSYNTEYKVIVRKKSEAGVTSVHTVPDAIITTAPTSLNNLAVSYNTDGADSEEVMGLTNLSPYDVIVLAPTPTKEGHEFLGWNDGVREANYPAEGKYTMQGTSVSMTAKWRPVYVITGIVTINLESGNTPVEDARVDLQKGSKNIEVNSENPTTTDQDGKYTFSGVPAGDYNIIVTHTTDDGTEVTMTKLVTVNSDGEVGTISMPTLKTNSVVTIQPPESGNGKNSVLDKLMVGQLDEQFDDLNDFTTDEEKQLIDNKDVSITLNLTITEKEEHQAPEDAGKIIGKADEDNKQIAAMFDLTVEKIITDANKNTSTEILNQLPSPVKIVIPLPLELQGKESYKLYLVHEDGEAEEIHSTLSEDRKTITFYIDKFSLVALAYSDLPPETLSSNADIGSLTSVSGATISDTTISATVEYGVTSQLISLALSNAKATWELYSDDNGSLGTLITDKNMLLEVGINSAFIKVLAEDGTEKIYNIIITRSEEIIYFIPSPSKVDKSNLEKSISESKKLNESDYTSKVWQTLQDELKKAQELLNKKGVTQSEIDAANQKLKGIVKNTVDKTSDKPQTDKNDETETDGQNPKNDQTKNDGQNPKDDIDKSKLENKSTDAEKLEESDYLPEDWKKLQDELAKAKEILQDDNVPQEEVDKALKALSDSIESLKTVDDEKSPPTNVNIPMISLIGLGLSTSTMLVLIRIKKKKSV